LGVDERAVTAGKHLRDFSPGLRDIAAMHKEKAKGVEMELAVEMVVPEEGAPHELHSTLEFRGKLHDLDHGASLRWPDSR